MKEDIPMRPKTIILLLSAAILFPGLAVGAVAGTAGGYLYDHHEKAQQKAHDQAYEQGYAAGKKNQ
jgi:hypothetical protein